MNWKYILCFQSHGWPIAYSWGRQARSALVPRGEARTVSTSPSGQPVPLDLCTSMVNAIKSARSNIFPGLPQRPGELYYARFGVVKVNINPMIARAL